MDDVIKLGPLLMKWDWVVIIVSGFFGYLLVRQRLKGTEEEKSKDILEALGNAIFISIMAWKLSYLLLNPLSVWNNPMVLLYFSGGYRGWMLAMICVYGYALFRSKKSNLPIASYLQSFGLGFSAASFLYHAMLSLISDADRWFNLGEMLLFAILIGWFYKGNSPDQLYQGFIWMGIGQIFLFFFQNPYVPVWLGLSKNQLIFLVVSVIGFLGSAKWINFKSS